MPFMGMTKSDSNKYINNHNIMMFFAIVFLIIGFVWLIGLSGAQTGSCTTSGFGSLVLSSENSNGDINSTYEVVAEFFISLFLILGVAMLTYILTLKKSSQKLIEKGQIYSALIVNGGKNIDDKAFTDAEKEQLQSTITLMGLPTNTISAGLTAIKQGRGIDAARGISKEDRAERQALVKAQRDKRNPKNQVTVVAKNENDSGENDAENLSEDDTN